MPGSTCRWAFQHAPDAAGDVDDLFLFVKISGAEFIRWMLVVFVLSNGFITQMAVFAGAFGHCHGFSQTAPSASSSGSGQYWSGRVKSEKGNLVPAAGKPLSDNARRDCRLLVSGQPSVLTALLRGWWLLCFFLHCRAQSRQMTLVENYIPTVMSGRLIAACAPDAPAQPAEAEVPDWPPTR